MVRTQGMVSACYGLNVPQGIAQQGRTWHAVGGREVHECLQVGGFKCRAEDRVTKEAEEEVATFAMLDEGEKVLSLDAGATESPDDVGLVGDGGAFVLRDKRDELFGKGGFHLLVSPVEVVLDHVGKVFLAHVGNKLCQVATVHN